MFGRKKRRSVTSSITGSLKREIADSIKREMVNEDRPIHYAREPQYDIPYLPKGRLNLSISLDKYNALPRSLRKIWPKIDLVALFAVEEPQDIPQLEEPTDPKQELLDNEIVKDNTTLRASILSETEDEQDKE